MAGGPEKLHEAGAHREISRFPGGPVRHWPKIRRKVHQPAAIVKKNSAEGSSYDGCLELKLSKVQRPTKHILGHIWTCFHGSNDQTVSKH